MKILYLYWGRHEAPYINDLLKSIEQTDMEIFLSLSRQNLNHKNYSNGRKPIHWISTYANKYQAIVNALKLPWIIRDLLIFIKEQKIDLVFCPMLHLWSPLLGRVLKHSGIPYALVVHDATPHPGEDSFLQKLLLKTSYPPAQQIITLTHLMKQDYELFFGKPKNEIAVVPHGLSAHYVRSTPKELPSDGRITVIFVGRIRKYKGLDSLLLAWPQIKQQIPLARLEIWGEGDVSASLEQIQQDSSIRLENRWVDDIELESVFERGDICVLPYTASTVSAVIFPTLAAAVPVVITPVPGLIEQLGDGGGVVAQSHAPEDFAAAVIQLATNAQLYREQSQKSINETPKHSWENSARQLYQLFDSMIKKQTL